MGFSSIPAYLDPSNWQQDPNPQYGCNGGTGNPQFPTSQLPSPPPSHVGGGDGLGSIRPGSMSDRARMANLPMPEAALKCPRCESTNTKFCYFNNYNLAQPRHFCKTCRRYWTRGGALRNVPVGGGCRRNKRSKGSSSKSPAGGDHQNNSGSSSSAISSNSTVGTANILGLLTPQIPQMPFMSPLSTQLSSYGDMNFQLASCSLGGGGGGGGEQWRWQPPQISSLGGLDLPAGLYPFQGGGVEASGYGGGDGGGQVRPRLSASGLLTQLAPSVKMEGNNQELNLSRQFLGEQGNNDQYWSTGASTTATAWTDLSGFTSSSTSNPI